MNSELQLHGAITVREAMWCLTFTSDLLHLTLWSQFHQFSSRWRDFLLLYRWITFCCVYAWYFLYLLVFWWTSRLFPELSCCELQCNKHGYTCISIVRYPGEVHWVRGKSPVLSLVTNKFQNLIFLSCKREIRIRASEDMVQFKLVNMEVHSSPHTVTLVPPALPLFKKFQA